jgi:hypothetical protein
MCDCNASLSVFLNWLGSSRLNVYRLPTYSMGYSTMAKGTSFRAIATRALSSTMSWDLAHIGYESAGLSLM